MKSRLFNIAWSIVDQFNSFAEALAHAWKVIKLYKALCTQATVNFTYRKIDGTIRAAIGTLTSTPATKGSDRKNNHSILTYFDVEQNGWRSSCVNNLIFKTWANVN